MATENKKALVYSILEFLKKSCDDGTIGQDDVEGIEGSVYILLLINETLNEMYYNNSGHAMHWRSLQCRSQRSCSARSIQHKACQPIEYLWNLLEDKSQVAWWCCSGTGLCVGIEITMVILTRTCIKANRYCCLIIFNVCSIWYVLYAWMICPYHKTDVLFFSLS